jgi:hypothetical protein
MRLIVSLSRTALTAAIVFAFAGTAQAQFLDQWVNYPWKNVPRTADGKVDLNAPAPKAADGKPDLSGFYMPRDFSKLLSIAGNRPEDVPPLQPWARELYQQRIDSNGKDHPGAYCLPSGIPEKLSIPDGLKVVQTPNLIVFLYESRTIYRQVFLDGRKLPKIDTDDFQPSWMGYSVGRWEGDTLVVETVGSNGKAWLDMKGLPGTEALHVTERYTRPNLGTVNIDVTIDDPKAYTKPWSFKVTWNLRGDAELIESICEENSKDAPHMVGK